MVNSIINEVSLADNLLTGPSGAKSRDSPCSWSFLLIHLRQNVSVYFYLWLGKQLRYFVAKEYIEKMIFYCYSEALKVFRKYRCHPVYEENFLFFFYQCAWLPPFRKFLKFATIPITKGCTTPVANRKSYYTGKYFICFRLYIFSSSLHR
jgi:hypothetical protein